MIEDELEPVWGLPQELPPGERILWQGQPQWWSLCRHVLHVLKLLVYFLILAAWRAADATAQGEPILAGLLWPTTLGLVAIGLFLVLGWLMSRTTVYTITNRRVVMRFGVALPINLNLPFEQVEQAQFKAYRDGSGDIPLSLGGSDRIAYLVLWPHARPWHVKRTQPMLRSVPDAEAVATLLSDTLRRYHGGGATGEPRVADDKSAISPKLAHSSQS